MVNVGAGALGDVTRVVGMLRLDVFLDADEKKLPEVSLLLCCPGYCIML